MFLGIVLALANACGSFWLGVISVERSLGRSTSRACRESMC